MKINLYEHQSEALNLTKDKNRVAYYLDMGLGKTFVGSEKMIQLGSKVNLIICQKSKIADWIEHFKTHYNAEIYDLTNKGDIKCFLSYAGMYETGSAVIFGVINYELVWRRKELLQIHNFTLMLDESSMIQNEVAKRSKFILKMKPNNVILLSGTPTSGKYEKLYSQLKLLGWNITKDLYYKQYIDFEMEDVNGFKVPKVIGYKNVERLKRKLKINGAVFMKSDEVFNLPKMIENIIFVRKTKEYSEFMKNSIINLIDIGKELVGDTTLTKMLYSRMLCGAYSYNKINIFSDLVDSTEDRLIVFYNFNNELEIIKKEAEKRERPLSIVNGNKRDLTTYEDYNNSITAIQYQAGAMGLNLQKANKIIYYTLPLSSELFEQSKKRVHRIGQEKSCFYYYLIVKGSIEEKIFKTLKLRKDYTDTLFKKEEL